MMRSSSLELRCGHSFPISHAFQTKLNYYDDYVETVDLKT